MVCCALPRVDAESESRDRADRLAGVGGDSEQPCDCDVRGSLAGVRSGLPLRCACGWGPAPCSSPSRLPRLATACAPHGLFLATQGSNARVIQGRNLVRSGDAAGFCPGVDRCACSAAPSRAGFGPPLARLFSVRCAVPSLLWWHFSVNEGQWSGAWVILSFPS